MEELGALYDKAVKEVGEDNAAIFEVHQMMLDDEDYCDSIRNIITTQEVNAEFAVATTGDNFAAMFAGMDDEYMKARSADVKDISERLIAVLHLKIDIERTDQNDDGCNGFHQVGNGCLIRTDFLRGFGKTRRTLTSRHHLRYGECECAESDCGLSSKRQTRLFDAVYRTLDN